MSVRLIHFADAHIDIISAGRKDPATTLPVRAADFLQALDKIIDAAIEQKVDLVLFAGDAYRDSTPTPTWQREWGKRMMRLSQAQITTLMIAGNHDVSPSSMRATALQDVDTFAVPYVHLAKRIQLWTPNELHGVPIQVITIPWVSKSSLLAAQDLRKKTTAELFDILQSEITARVHNCIAESDPELPLVLMAHYSVLGAVFPSQYAVSLGNEITLETSLVKDPVFSYTALGHIHKFQDLNSGQQPPVVYSGSIERVNFGEVNEAKGYVLAEIDNHHTNYNFCVLEGRQFFNREITIQNPETFQTEVMAALPDPQTLSGAMVRLIVNYPKDWESNFDEKAVRKAMESALEFHLVCRATAEARMRIPTGAGVSSLPPLELVKKYCESFAIGEDETDELVSLAAEIITDQI